jgi:hypothetical protein
MNPVVKGLWLKALRSNHFPQWKGGLRSDAGYCCLGVLCEVAVRAGVIPEPVYNDGCYTYQGNGDVLPVAVVAWAGVDRAGSLQGIRVMMPIEWDLNPYSGQSYNSLAELNDHGMSFQEIAYVIEAHL